MDTKASFVPLLLGADINVYSMARAFHEAYGVRTVAYGMYPSGPCYGSSVIDYRVSPRNDEPEVVLDEVCRHFGSRSPAGWMRCRSVITPSRWSAA